MSWVRSSQEIEGHWKLQNLCLKTGWDPDLAIGRLHRFWWWVQKYAEDGDLSRFSSLQIDFALRLPTGTKFLEILIETQWVDSVPYLRIHDWWDHNGPWLQSKYKHYPEKWESIKRRYKSEKGMNRSKNRSKPVHSTGIDGATNLTEDVEDVTKIKKKQYGLAHARGRKGKLQTATTPAGPIQPVTNRSRTSSSPEPSEDMTQVVEFIQANLPAGAAPPDLSAEWEGHTLETETERYRENGIKAAWTIYVDPGTDSYAYAAGQHFSVREFLRQISALTDHPGFASANRRFRDGIMKRYNIAPAAV